MARIAARINMAQAIQRHNLAAGGGGNAIATGLLNRKRAILAQTGETAEITRAELLAILTAVCGDVALRDRLVDAVSTSAANRANAATAAQVAADRQLVDDLVACVTAVDGALGARLSPQGGTNNITVPNEHANAVAAIMQEFGANDGMGVHNMGYYDQIMADEGLPGVNRYAYLIILYPRLNAMAARFVASFEGRPQGIGGQAMHTLQTANAFFQFDGQGGRPAPVTAQDIAGINGGRGRGAGAAAALNDLNVPYVFLIIGSVLVQLTTAGTIVANQAWRVAGADQLLTYWTQRLRAVTRQLYHVRADNTIQLCGAVGANCVRGANAGTECITLFMSPVATNISCRIFTPTPQRAVRCLSLLGPTMEWHRILVVGGVEELAGNFQNVYHLLDEVLGFIGATLRAGHDWYDCVGTDVCLFIAKLLTGRKSLLSVRGARAQMGNMTVGPAWNFA